MWGMGTVVRAQRSRKREDIPRLMYVCIYKGERSNGLPEIKSKVFIDSISGISDGSALSIHLYNTFAVPFNLPRKVDQRKAEEKIKQKQKRFSNQRTRDIEIKCNNRINRGRVRTLSSTLEDREAVANTRIA